MKENDNNRPNSSDWRSASDWFSQKQNERINTSHGLNDPESRNAYLREQERRRMSESEPYMPYEERPVRREARQPEITKAKGRDSKKKRKEKRRFDEFSRKNRNSGKSKDELRREYAEKTRKRRKRRIAEWFIFTALIFAAIFVVASLTVLFPIEEITVQGDTRYSAEEIIEASGVETGDNLWRTSASAVSGKVSTELPYVGSVKLSRTIPSAMTFIVEETSPAYAVKNGKRYILIDEQGKILELRAKKSGKTIIFEGLKLVNAQAGHKIEPEIPETYQTAKEILQCASENNIKLKSVNVGDTNNISAVCNKKIRLDLGAATQLSEKMKMANEVILKLKEEGSLNEGVINLKSTTKAFYKDGPIKEPETTAPSTESVTDENGNEVTTQPVTDVSGNAVTSQAPSESQGTTEAATQDATQAPETSQPQSETASSINTETTQSRGADIPEPPATRPQG